MSGTVNARFGLEEMTTDRKPLLAPWAANALVGVFVFFLLACLFAYGQGVVDEYRGMAHRLDKAEDRAAVAEKQVAVMLRSGDQGILLSSIQGLGPGTLRFVPSPQGKR
jgi:hypothetical protein